MRLFISYARIDKPFCIQFVNILDVHEVWYDQRLYAGQHWWKEILRRLEWCEGFIYLLSPDSIASEYCLKELEIAQRLGRVIIPVLIHSETEIPKVLSDLQYVEMLRGLSAENVKAVLNAIYLVEHPRKTTPSPVSRLEHIDNQTRSSPVSQSAKIVGMAASALENAEYDRAVLLLRQAKEGGFQSRFINIDRLLEEAEIALETLSREREAKREYEQILELFHYQRTRMMACEAFLQFQEAFPDYDPQNLQSECLRIKSNPPAQPTGKNSAGVISLPLLEWCEIPAGNVYVEDPRNHQDKRWTLESFDVSKYPVTNAQFAAFISAVDGYCNPNWWRFSKAANRWFQEHPDPFAPHFSGDDRPRETVNWYEAVAFSNWLGYKLNATISLPTLAQWQRAAFGDDERLYPWGNNFNPEACNTRENGLKMTTSVKRYSAGVSPFGVYDLAGNVWEWCLDKLDPEEGGQDYRQAVIGGSFVSPCDRAQSSFRYFLNPEARYSSIGFRVLRLPKSANLSR